MTNLVEQFKALEQQFQDNFKQQDGNYYLISKQWLDQWKQKVGYEQQPDTSIQLNQINADIAQKVKAVLKYDPIESHPWNIQLLPDLLEGQTYIVIDSQMWAFFKQYQKGRIEYTIERESYINNDGERIIQAYYQNVKFVPIFPSSINKMSSQMIEGYQQINPNVKISDLVTIFEKTLKTVTSFKFVSKNSVRLYKLPSDWTLQKIKDYVLTNYKEKKLPIEFPEIEFLNPDDNKIFKDYNFQSEQTLIMDAKEYSNTFSINNPLFEKEEKCVQCYQFNVLKYECDCKKVKYCSDQCQSQHQYIHAEHCEKSDDNDEILVKLLITEQSKLGLTGLRNLGNTCYMNSALQCLSHTLQISRYFIDNSYKFDINLNNTLGTKGKFASILAYLFKRLWIDTKITQSPYQFKRTISNISQVFAGNAQHDAQEFITFALDLLNEDLNRVKIKPYVEIPDGNGRSDEEVSQEQWDCFKKRNDSIIVDQMYGQYRSKLQCPICNKISITFDPYLMVNVTIPQEQKKNLEFYIVDSENYWLHKTVIHYYEPELRLKEILQFKSQEWLNCEWDQIICTLSSVFQIEEVFLDQRMQLLKKQLKQDKKLLLRQLTVNEQTIQNDDQIHVLVHNQIQTANNWKKDIIQSMYFIFSTKQTYKEMHLFLFDCFKGVMKHLNEFNQEWLLEENKEQIYEQHILNKYWKLIFKTNQRYQVNCSYCYKNYCTDCSLDFIDKLFGDCLERDDKLLQPELQIVWLKPCKENIEEIYNDFQLIFDPTYKPPQRNLNWDSQSNKNKQTYSLEHCLQYSTQPEQLALENSWYCSNCKDHVQAYKTLQIYKTPNILVFHLKRFKDSYKQFKSKLQTNILFPEQLDMKDFTLYQQNLNKYELYAVCNHIGESGSGHYTAFCKNNQTWYKFDDNYVTKETNSVITQNAYVLFYKRINDDDVIDNYSLSEKLQQNIDLLMQDEIFKKSLEIENIQNITEQEINQKQEQELTTIDLTAVNNNVKNDETSSDTMKDFDYDEDH